MIVTLSVMVVLLGSCSAHAAAQAGQVVGGDGHSAATRDAGAKQLHKPCLNTGFMSITSPQIHVVGPGRPDTTRIRLQLQQHQTSSFMPIVSVDAAKGLTHNVVDTWKFLQHYALQSKLVRAFNDKQAGTNTPLRYPHAANSIRAASALLSSNDAVSGVAASRHLLRTAETALDYTHTAPTNVLLLAGGASVAAVADILSVDAVGASPDAGVSVTLDVVHTPGPAVSEFESHSPQTLDEQAHYHFFTPAGVHVDAARFLALVKGSAQALPGLHVFTKAIPSCISGAPCFNDNCPDDEGTCDNSGRCVCPRDTCTPGKLCRPAVSLCDVAEVCPESGICPPDAKKHNGARCPWFPRSHKPYGRYSVDVSSMRPIEASAQEATARLSSAPSLYKEDGWPTCEGSCIHGVCALKWSHPACCRVGGGHGYASQEGEAHAASDNSHWEGEFYCWGY